MRAFTLPATAGLLLAMGALSACGGRHHLAEYDFVDRSVAVVYFGAPAPALRTGGYALNADDGVGAVLAAGGRVAREVEARRARARLDSAAHRVDLSARMAERTLERASRYLGARPVTERGEADYLLEVDVRSLGLEARSDRSYLFVSGITVLLDARSGREIWSADIRSHDPLTPDLVAGGVFEDVLGAGALSLLSVEEFEAILNRLGDYAADRMAQELRGDLRKVRNR